MAVLGVEEGSDRGVEAVGRLEVAEMAYAGQDHKRGRPDLCVQCLADLKRGSLVGVALEQQCRHRDARQDVAEVGLGHGMEHRPVARGTDVAHEGEDVVDHRLWCGIGKHPGDVRGRPFGRRALVFLQQLS